MPDEGSRSIAGLLQLPCRALGSLADDEPHRKRIRNGPAQDSADERFVVVNYRQADGVQVGHRRIENLATAERHKSLAEDCRRCQIQRWHRGPRSAGKPRRLITPRHLKSHIARPTVVAGDFNDNVLWDKPKKLNNHGSNVSTLTAYGLQSAYHKCRGVGQGSET